MAGGQARELDRRQAIAGAGAALAAGVFGVGAVALVKGGDRPAAETGASSAPPAEAAEPALTDKDVYTCLSDPAGSSLDAAFCAQLEGALLEWCAQRGYGTYPYVRNDSVAAGGDGLLHMTCYAECTQGGVSRRVDIDATCDPENMAFDFKEA